MQALAPVLLQVLGRYQARARLVLYDCIATLAEAVQAEFVSVRDVLMPALLGKWESINMASFEFPIYLECLTACARALDSNFRPYSAPCLEKLLGVISHYQSLVLDADEKTGLVCAIDMVESIAPAFDERCWSYLAPNDVGRRVLDMISKLCDDASPDVRQAVFALIGTATKHGPPDNAPFMSCIPVLANNIDPLFVNVCNNAAWAIGEIAMKVRRSSW